MPPKRSLKKEAIEWGKALLYAFVAATIIRLFVFETMLVPTGSMIPTINVGDRLFIEKITYTAREPEIGDIVVFWSPFIDERAQTMLRLFDKFMDLFAPARFRGHVKYVKRLVAKGGDVIQIKLAEDGNYHLFVNGKIPEGFEKRVYSPEGIFQNPQLLNLFIEASRLRDKPNEYKLYLQNLARQDSYTANLVFSVVGGMYPVPLGVPFDKTYDEIYKGIDLSKYIRKTSDGVEVQIPQGFYFFMGDNTKDSFDSRYFGFVPVDHVIGRPILRIWPLKEFGPVQGR
ncbi:MAG TPA: signal peptidase I [Pseudothermotoga sp.]|nr:signal peptidase I [Pseudothermotoga sp.]HOK84479.1 signal peptidase I [Pseudothermotoga sp.]HPP70919.1 signal peptidase I [Pseudothermotoga sp.]